MTIDPAITVHEGEEVLTIPGWRELLAQDPQRHLFATPEWNRIWWEEFRSGKDLFALTMRRGDDVIAVVPLYRKTEDGRRILRWIGGIDLTDYLGPICSLEERATVAEALVQWLEDTNVAWDEFDAHNMPVPFGFAEFLVERADAAGYRFEIHQEETAAVLPLPQDWDAYLDGLDTKERHELKRKRRRLAREIPDAAIRRATSETLEEDLASFIAMHRGAEGHKGHFMKPEIATFFERVARATEELGWLRLDLLEVAGSPLASTFGFEFNNTFYLYNSAFEQEARRLSPGFVLVTHLIEQSIDSGLAAFDFLRGPERYKYQLGAQAVPLHNVRIFASEEEGRS